jgi:hypothetical protein
MAGIYRRRIRVEARGGSVRAGIEDDPHHFRVTLRHDGARVLEIGGESVRFPWSACANAASELEVLRGAALSPRMTAVGALSDPREHCTHLYDLAGLAMACAARGEARLQYDIAVPEPILGPTRVTLVKNGALLLAWDIANGAIQGPAPFAGVALVGKFLGWATAHLSPELFEAAVLLRRACMIARCRIYSLDQVPNAASLNGAPNRWFTPQPARAAGATWMLGTSIDWTDRPDALLADFWRLA